MFLQILCTSLSLINILKTSMSVFYYRKKRNLLSFISDSFLKRYEWSSSIKIRYKNSNLHFVIESVESFVDPNFEREKQLVSLLDCNVLILYERFEWSLTSLAVIVIQDPVLKRYDYYCLLFFQKETLVDKAKDLSEDDSEAHIAKLIRLVSFISFLYPFWNIFCYCLL